MIPERKSIAYLPTPIETITWKEEKNFPALYLKRDDLTGVEWSGNKIRKLEYLVADALKNDYDTLITCGGIQSNHCRATAAVAARLGLECILLLRTDQRMSPSGNHLLDGLLGAEVRFVTASEYRHQRMQIMEDIAKERLSQGHKTYIIPEGASNALGCFGYYHAFEEVLTQEKEQNLNFDTIVCAVGSGGTYAGLVFANKILNAGKQIIGVNVCDSAEFFREVTQNLWQEFRNYFDRDDDLDPSELQIIDGHVGRGYALNTPQEMDFLRTFSTDYGIILDPVYTGKAMKGLIGELQKEDSLLKDAKNILFIHTGGMYGLFPKADEFGL